MRPLPQAPENALVTDSTLQTLALATYLGTCAGWEAGSFGRNVRATRYAVEALKQPPAERGWLFSDPRRCQGADASYLWPSAWSYLAYLSEVQRPNFLHYQLGTAVISASGVHKRCVIC